MRLDKFTYTDYGEQLPIHPAVHIFFYITFMKGMLLGPLLFLDFTVQSLLLRATTEFLTPGVAIAWGVAAVLVTVINTIGIAARHRGMHNVAAMGGFMVWVYATTMYFLGGFYYQFLVLGVPNIVFWAWYYLATKKRTRQ